ncbi:MAG: hypothetical protein IK121_02650 [Lachnospiraceae bacterium]|nr:hypothetical protein [Lachnospiraceae bacterium]
MKIDKRTGIIAALIFITGIIMYVISGEASVEIEDIIQRNEPNEESSKYVLEADVDGLVIEDIEFSVNQRDYTKEECEELFENNKERIIKEMLGENKELTNITEDINLYEKIKGLPFDFSFTFDDYTIVSETGEILTTEESVLKVSILAQYKDFNDSLIVKVLVKPGPGVMMRAYKNELMAKLRDSLNVADSEVYLPKEIDGKAVGYRVPEKKRNPIYLFGAMVASVSCILGQKKDEKKANEKRKKEIMKEYPALLQKMSLYQATGMTIRNVWNAIYLEGLKKKGKKSPLYAEMGVSINELQSGISEPLVYRHFGERVKTTEMVRFTALLSQNLRKGSSSLKKLLEEESERAFVYKKQTAIKEGEEAGTKLLFPMMFLLIDILIIIMVPAFWTM